MEKVEKVRAVVKAAKEIDDQLDALRDVIGVVPESPFIAAVFGLYDVAVKSLGEHAELVWWYLHDNDHGRGELEATPDADKYPMRPIKTVEDLLWLLQLS